MADTAVSVAVNTDKAALVAALPQALADLDVLLAASGTPANVKTLATVLKLALKRLAQL